MRGRGARGLVVALALLVAAAAGVASLAARVASVGEPQASSDGQEADAGVSSGAADAGEADESSGQDPGEAAEPEVAAGAAQGPLGSQATRYESDRPLAEEAEALLEARERAGDCVVLHAGYLDVTGGTWGCVFQGSGWAEVCLVSERPEGCSVVTLRMDAEGVQGALGSGG